MINAKKNILFKVVALTVSLVFFWNQLVWAGGVPTNPTLPNDNTTYQDEIAGISTSELELQISNRLSMISSKNEIENFIQEQRTAEPPAGSVTYEYDELGRISKIIYSDDSFMVTEYQGDTDVKSQDKYFEDGWVWQRSVVYHEDGVTVQNMYIADQDTENDGDAVSCEFDILGRATRIYMDNGDLTISEYLADTLVKTQDQFFAENWVWKATMQYHADGESLQFVYIADDDLSVEGDVTYGAFDELGRNIKMICDNGEFIVTEYWGDTESKYRDIFFVGDWVWQTTVVYNDDGITLDEVAFADTDPSTMNDVIYCNFDELGRIEKIKFDSGNFIVTEYWGDTQAKYRDMYFEGDWIWLASVEFYDDGNTFKNMWFTDPDPGTPGDEREYRYDELGRLTRIICDNDAITTFEYWNDTLDLYRVAYYDPGWEWRESIEFWEEYANVEKTRWLADPDTQSSGDVREYRYDELGRVTRITCDNEAITTFEYWNDTLDLYRVAYYDPGWEWRESIEFWEDPAGIARYKWATDIDPSAIGNFTYIEYDTLGRETLTKVDTEEWIGVTYWGDTNNRKFETYCAADWTWQKNVEYWEDGLTLHHKWIAAGDEPEQTTVTFEAYDDVGRLVMEKFYSEAYKTFTYHQGGDIVNESSYYLPDGTHYLTEVYDDQSVLQASRYYYNNGFLKEVLYTDGAWEKYAEDGTLVETGEVIDDLTVTRNADGMIVRLADGTQVEERSYVYHADTVLYTLALADGNVCAINEGEYTSLALTSAAYTTGDTVSVTYDNDVTVQYTGDEITSLSVEDGYMNFFTESGTGHQVSTDGTYYAFSNNYLGQVATVNGNVYNFTKTDYAQGAEVVVTSAVIDGTYCTFDGATLTSIEDTGSGTVVVTELDILNNLGIGSLKVDRGQGEEILTEADTLYQDISALITSVNGDIPNLKFQYNLDNEINDILTSEHTQLSFEDGLISQTVSAEGVAVDYEYIMDGDYTTVTGLRMIEAGCVREFDAAGNLISIEFDDGGEMSTVNFTDGILDTIESGDITLDDIVLDVEGNIDSSTMIDPDGSQYFFEGGTLQDFINGDDIHYEVDDDGNITQLTRLSSGEVFLPDYRSEPGAQPEIIAFVSETNGTEYVYVDDLLMEVNDPAGVDIDYNYDGQNRILRMDISYGGVRSSTYNYAYIDDQTLITDDIGNIRTFGADGRVISLETPYNETYLYGYDEDENGDPMTFINFTYKDYDDGTRLEYFRGQLVKVNRPDGSYIDNIKFDTVEDELKRFTLHTSEGKHHNVLLEGDFLQIEMEDSSRLVFYEDKLVALGSSQGIVPLYDIETLKDIIFSRDDDGGYIPPEAIDVAASNWRHQTYDDTMAIQFVERDYTNNQWEVDLNLIADDTNYSKGEMYLDLRYDIPGLAYQAPINMQGEEISFLIQLDDNFDYNPNYPPKIQVFAKDDNWNSQYGMPIEVIRTGSWLEVSLIPTEDDIHLGFTDPGFDPTKITMIGLRVTANDNAPAGEVCIGDVLVKHNILPDLFENVNYEGTAVDDLYESLGLTRDLDLLDGEGEPMEEEAYLRNFADALNAGPTGSYQESLLDGVCWHVETEATHIQGIQSVYREAATGEYVLGMDISSTDQNNTEGEIYFDVRSDVPGLGWNQPINFTGQPLRVLIQVPEGMIGPEEEPNGARIFVEDDSMRLQYGSWTNLKLADNWYELVLEPTSGEIPMGYTDPDFDASKIVKIGINIATKEGSETDFDGEIRVKFLPPTGGEPTGDIVNMPLWMDLRGVQEYLVDEEDNYIRVPWVNYLPEEYFSYIFNMGSGEAPTANFDAIEESNTVWQEQDSGITSYAWDASGTHLNVNIDITSTDDYAELFLDLRYDCYVPNKNWQDLQGIDMSTQELTFYVRTTGDYTTTTSVPLQLEAFVQSPPMSPAWSIEYSQPVSLSTDGEWTKVTITPSPTDFNQNYVDEDFNPENVIGMGLRIKSAVNGETHTGGVEVRYEVNAVDLGTVGLGDDGTLPEEPVWVNQRDLVEWLQTQELALFGDYQIMTELKQVVSDLPTHLLPSDFVAFTAYDKTDTVVSITKPNATTTWFDDNGMMDMITYESGDIFIDYGYDDMGELINATLVDSRNKLQAAMTDAVYDVNKETADALILLAEQKSLIVEDFMIDVNDTRRQFASERSRLEGMRYREIKHSFLWWTWTERVEVPGVAEAINELNNQEAEFNQQVSEQLAQLDDEIAQQKADVESQRDKVLEVYAWHNQKMLLSIMRQETVPLAHYYYRKVLGRDATIDEMSGIYDRLDAQEDFAGFFVNEVFLPEDIVMVVGDNTTNPINSYLSEDMGILVSTYTQGDTLEQDQISDLANCLDTAVRSLTLYEEFITFYGDEAAVRGMLSQETINYLDSLTCLTTPPDELTETEINQIRWLNRYILVDILPGLESKSHINDYFSGETLRQELEGLVEHQVSVAFKQMVINDVITFFEDYMLGDTAAKETMLASLGITLSEIVNVDDAFMGAIQTWLDDQDLHFGKSAFGSLKKMLDEKGLATTLEEIARQAILMDVLLGISGPMTGTKLEISMYTMSKVAELYGVQCQNARLNYDDILALEVPFVTLINTHHYITVLSVTETEVTYYEHNLGENGDTVTISRQEFENTWQGNTITADPNVDQTKLLSAEEAKKIKGAFFGIIAFLIGYVINIVVAVAAIAIDIIIGVVGAIGGFLGNVFAGIAGVVGKIAAGLSFLGKAYLGTFGLGSAMELGGGWTLGLLVDGAATTLVNMGIGYGVTAGLESMGVDPLISGIVASVITGGISGFIAGGGSVINAFQSAIQWGLTATMGVLGDVLDLHPLITKIMTMSTSILTGAWFDPLITFGEAIANIAVRVVDEVINYGIQIAGMAMGIDPTLTSLISIGFRTSLRLGLSFLTAQSEIEKMEGVEAEKITLKMKEDGYGYEFDSKGVRVYGSVPEERLFSLGYDSEEIYNTLPDDGMDGFLLFVLDKLLEKQSPHYVIYEKVAQFYNYFVDKYNGCRERALCVAENNFSQQHDEISEDWSNELEALDNLWIDGQIGDDEYFDMVGQLGSYYEAILQELLDDYVAIRNNIFETYIFDLVELPRIGDDDE